MLACSPQPSQDVIESFSNAVSHQLYTTICWDTVLKEHFFLYEEVQRPNTQTAHGGLLLSKDPRELKRIVFLFHIFTIFSVLNCLNHITHQRSRGVWVLNFSFEAKFRKLILFALWTFSALLIRLLTSIWKCQQNVLIDHHMVSN